MALTFLSNAGYASSDDAFWAPSPAPVASCAFVPADSVGLLSQENIKHVTYIKERRERLPTLPSTGYDMPPEFISWLVNVTSEISISSSHKLKLDRALTYFHEQTAGKYHFPIPNVGIYDFGFSHGFSRDSDIYRILSNILSNKLRSEGTRQLDILDLGSGHAFWALQLFMENANIVCQSTELCPELVELFKDLTKPMLTTVDSEKADRFSLFQADVRDPSHLLFTTTTKRDMVTAFHLFHYLDVKDWPAVLQNMHSALRSDGFAVFVMSFKESDVDLSMAKLIEGSGVADQGPAKIKAYLRGFPALAATPEDLIDFAVARSFEDPRFPLKMKRTDDGFAPTLDNTSPGTILPDGSLIVPYSFNALQAIHCVEHTGHFRAQSYGILDVKGQIVSKEEALGRSEAEGFSIFVIASPVSLARLAGGAMGGAGVATPD